MMSCTNSGTEWVSRNKEQEIDMEKETTELGTKETEEFMGALKVWIAEMKKNMADKKMSFTEVLGIIPESLKVITEGRDYKLILDEIKDLRGEEPRDILLDLVDTFFAVNE